MKKLIIISIFLVFLISLGVYESVFSNKVFSEIYASSTTMIEVLNREEVDNESLVLELKNIEEKWNNYRPFALMFLNHTTVKDFTQKLNTLKGYVDKNDKKEAYIALMSLKVTTEFLLRETIPLFENIL